jgi:hypothetical protein
VKTHSSPGGKNAGLYTTERPAGAGGTSYGMASCTDSSRYAVRVAYWSGGCLLVWVRPAASRSVKSRWLTIHGVSRATLRARNSTHRTGRAPGIRGMQLGCGCPVSQEPGRTLVSRRRRPAASRVLPSVPVRRPGPGVALGGRAVAVGGTGVAVGGCRVAVGGRGGAVAGARVPVGERGTAPGAAGVGAVVGPGGAAAFAAVAAAFAGAPVTVGTGFGAADRVGVGATGGAGGAAVGVMALAGTAVSVGRAATGVFVGAGTCTGLVGSGTAVGGTGAAQAARSRTAASNRAASAMAGAQLTTPVRRRRCRGAPRSAAIPLTRPVLNGTADEPAGYRRNGGEMMQSTNAPRVNDTIADLVDRSGSEAAGPLGWLELAVQQLWEESPQRRAYDALAADVPERFSDDLTAFGLHAVWYAARAGYVLGSCALLHERERVAVAKETAGQIGVYAGSPFAGAAETAGDAGALARLGAWLAEACPGVTVEDAITAVPELGRLGRAA